MLNGEKGGVKESRLLTPGLGLSGRLAHGVRGCGMSPEAVDAVCSECGATFKAFLEQMAEHNEKVVCPQCAARKDCGDGVRKAG